jgi:ABC-type oligopeptide transport system substrate-binding subunit
LGIETDIVLKSWDEYEAAIASGDFDIVRRSFVMQTVDEATVIRSLFSSPAIVEEPDSILASVARTPAISASPTGEAASEVGSEQKAEREFSDERTALESFAAIPISFASSYALVKPYVAGFDSNLLDVPLLKNVRIESAAAANTAE